MNEKEPESINSWEHVDKIRKRLQDSDGSRFDSLEEEWGKLESSQPNLIARDGVKYIAETPIRALRLIVQLGFYPPPELLLLLLDCFEQYENSNGALEIEEILFGSRKRGIGNQAARNKKFRQNIALATELMVENKKRSDIEIAEDFVEKHSLDIDPESLLRSFRRWHAGEGQKFFGTEDPSSKRSGIAISALLEGVEVRLLSPKEGEKNSS